MPDSVGKGAHASTRPRWMDVASALLVLIALLVALLFTRSLAAQAGPLPDANRVVDAAAFGVAARNSGGDNSRALNGALSRATRLDAPGEIVLPPGELVFDGDVILAPMTGDAGRYRQQVVLRGSGSGQNGTWLHFRSGSLRVRAANHKLSDFRVTSDNSDGIVIEANSGREENVPARSMMSNVRAENCAGSGIVMSGNWIYLMENVYARYNAKWGIEGRNAGPFGLSANGWTILGGEFQGNGVSGRGGLAGGGGVYTGRSVQFVMVGSTIEGNRGDGLRIGEQARGVGIYNVYFEKNGSHRDNRDIVNDRPSNAASGPSSVTIIGSNFTPSPIDGRGQAHAIDLTDVQGLKIISPQFYGSGANHYSGPLVRVSETTPGKSTGWIENPYLSWSGYTQPVLSNETARYGFPRKSVISTNALLQPSTAENDDLVLATIPVPDAAGQQVDVRAVLMAGDFRNGKAVQAGQGSTTVRTFFRRGPRGTAFSIKEDTLEFRGASAAAQTISQISRFDPAEADFLMIGMERGPGLSGPLSVMSVEVTLFEGVVDD